MDFIKYLTSLSPEGETPLFMVQKPIGNGMYTWPAYYPDCIPNDAKAIYANTASFIRDRMGAKPSPSLTNTDYVLCMMLDDIGTKTPRPTLQPTWVIETSPGNFQWGYVFSEQPKKEDFIALMKAMAAAGHTDEGALGATRNFRIPGSINLKPGRDNFAAKLVEFQPDRGFTLDDICKAFNVIPGESESSGPKHIKLEDTGPDSILNWLNDNNLVLAQANQEGWVSIVCPNHAAHTDGALEARYLPKTRAFSCFHGHCQELDSAGFLGWIAKQGGPNTSSGIRPELVQPVIANAIAKITKGNTVGTPADWYKRYAYLKDENAFFDTQTNALVSRRAFDSLYRHIDCKSIHNNRKIEASIAYDEGRESNQARVYDALTYHPGEAATINRDDKVFANTWRDARPIPEYGDASLWLAHAARLVPDKAHCDHLLDMLAFKVQHPETKINHAILIGGVEGAGKDTLLAPFFWAIGGASKRNCTIVETEGLTDRWGYAKETEVMEICELKQVESKDRRGLANKLKPIVTAPPDWISIERKGQHPYMAINKILVIAYTNERDSLALSSEDRRWFCLWVDAGKLPTPDALKLWAWFRDEGGFAKVAGYLHSRDVSHFNPTAPPPFTQAKATMIESTRSAQESFLIDLIVNRRGDFAAGVVASPLANVLDRVSGIAPMGMKLHTQALRHALKEAGWVDIGQVKPYNKPGRCIHCAPELAEKPKNDLYDLIGDL